MSAVLERVDPGVELARMHAALDALATAELSGLSDEALLDYLRGKERLVRRLASLDHAAVVEIERRGLPGANFLRNSAVLLRGLLRLDPREAHARLAAARAAGARQALTGQPLPPIYPVVAAAQAAGEISERHARVIVDTVERLPEAAQAEHGERIESELVEFAHRFDPHQLATLARRIVYCYDQDGALDQVEHRERQRGLTVAQRVDGSASITGEATAELAELLLTSFDALAKPLPEATGSRTRAAPPSAATTRCWTR